MIFLADILKQYKELNKSFIYDVLKSDIPFTNNKKWNKRYFIESDIEKFLYIKNNGLEKAIKKYWINSLKQSEKCINKKIINIDDKQTKTVLEINKLNEIIKIKEEQNQKYALLYKEERRDKELIMKDKEEERNERIIYQKKYENLLINNNKLKYLVILLVCILLFSLVLNSGIITINL